MTAIYQGHSYVLKGDSPVEDITVSHDEDTEKIIFKHEKDNIEVVLEYYFYVPAIVYMVVGGKRYDFDRVDEYVILMLEIVDTITQEFKRNKENKS